MEILCFLTVLSVTIFSLYTIINFWYITLVPEDFNTFKNPFTKFSKTKQIKIILFLMLSFVIVGLSLIFLPLRILNIDLVNITLNKTSYYFKKILL